MRSEDLEQNLQGLSYLEMCYKTHFLNNKPFIKKVGYPIDPDLQIMAKEYVQQMTESRGMEDSPFLGTGSFERSSFQVDFSGKAFLNEHDKNTLDSNALISEAADIALMRIPRYLDLTEIFDSISILYVLSGEFNLTIADKTFSLKKGNIVIVPPYVMIHLLIDNDSTVVLSLVIRTSSFAKNFQCVIESGNTCSDFFIKMLYDKERTPFSIFESPFDEYLKDLLFRIMVQQYQFSEYQNLLIRNLTEDIILRLFSYHKKSMTIYDNNFRENELISRILVYLHKNYSSVTLKDVSREFSYSGAHISRVLCHGLGKKYQELITEIRLNKAKELLTHTNLSIEEICNILGYSNPRHLRFLFNKSFNTSPSKYRKLTYSSSGKQSGSV